MDKPLVGVRILAVEQYGAGPFGTQILADLGAEVIKVENRELGGDYARTLGPYFVDGAESDEGSLFFQSVNRNKKSISLDLAQDEGKQVFRRLVKNVDAVANNLRGDVPEKLGITYECLSDYNPALVCAHCSAYGREGPRKDWPGYDYLMQAETGYFYMSGEPDSPPTRMGLSIVDFMAGTNMALGLLAGVISARNTGQGRDVDINLFDTALSNMSYLSTWVLNSEFEPSRNERSAHPSLVPCQLYKTADGWIYLMCNKEKFWQQLCELVDEPQLASDQKYATFKDRLPRRSELTEVFDKILSKKSTGEWLKIFAKKIPAAPVCTPRQAILDYCATNPDKTMTLKLSSCGGQFTSLKTPIQTKGNGKDQPCPPLGQNTEEILQSAGFSKAEISDLRQKRII